MYPSYLEAHTVLIIKNGTQNTGILIEEWCHTFLETLTKNYTHLLIDLIILNKDKFNVRKIFVFSHFHLMKFFVGYEGVRKSVTCLNFSWIVNTFTYS